jgi:hypothetical protein
MLLAQYWPYVLACILGFGAIAGGIVIWTARDTTAVDPTEAGPLRQGPAATKGISPGDNGVSANVFGIEPMREALSQIDVQAASHALIDMGRGKRRANPYEAGPHDKRIRYQLAYLQAWVERDHAIADSRAGLSN